GEAWSRVQHNSSPRIAAERHNAKALEAARADTDQLLTILDGALVRSSYLLGTDFSIVDAHVASWTAYLVMMGHDLAKHPAVAAWNARCTARPAFKTAMP